MTFLAPAWRRGLVVALGIIAGQFLLYGPALAGRKVLLPLDYLAQPDVSLLPAAFTARFPPAATLVYSDLVYVWEPARRFAVDELHAGRLPLWMPFQYAGVPFLWPWLSPFMWLEAATASPVVLAWTQLAMALTGGGGAYAFFRRSLGLGFRAAVVGAWCYPLTLFFVLWQGFPTCAPVYWLPWSLLAVDSLVRRRAWRTFIGVGVVTGLILVAGALDVGGQVLLVTGLFALWRFAQAHGRDWRSATARAAALAIAGGWLAGFALAAPYTLPLLEYAHTGVRMQHRAAGAEARPPEGGTALLPVVLPEAYGANQAGSLRLGRAAEVESSSTAYAGLLAALVAAPLAWSSRRHRAVNTFWTGLIVVCLGWCLNLPGVVQILRLPGLNMMSHNRLVFGAAFGILALAATGLDGLRRGDPTPARRGWPWLLPVGALALVGGWCAYRAAVLPEPLATALEHAVARGQSLRWVHTAADVSRAQAWFRWYFAGSALLAVAGLGFWGVWYRRTVWPVWGTTLLSAALVLDLWGHAAGRRAQGDPALYYPRVPVLRQLAGLKPGRIVGWQCLPANLAQTEGLSDIRGYDAVDPDRLIDLLRLTADPHATNPEYAAVQWFYPRAEFTPPDHLRLPPILDLLGVRYLVLPGEPAAGLTPRLRGDNAWVLVNERALPRVFVPGSVSPMASDHEILAKMADDAFDPRATVYANREQPALAACRGEAKIVGETPTRVTIRARMDTAGMVVLADRWDAGWRAFLNGQAVPIQRVDHALRGIAVPPGAATLEFRYEPASLRRGLVLAVVAAVTLGGVAGWNWPRDGY